MKIFLLEDDVLLNQAIKKYLEKKGHSVYSLREGTQALEVLKTNSFDLLILDINVPGISGLTLLEKLYVLKVMTPVIFISALVDIEDISRAYELGCYDYLKKPFHLKELELRINKLLQVTKPPSKHIRLSKGYNFDMENETLFFYNDTQVLANRHLQILKLLGQNRGIVIGFDTFREYAWQRYDISDSTIRAEINRLKKILKEDFILNVRSLGYVINKIE